jgi:hypothetical protein
VTVSRNPYASPRSRGDLEADQEPKLTVKSMLLLLLIGVFGGAALGAASNCVNGAVSPEFFDDHILIYSGTDSLWLASVVQGVAEGALDGLIYGLLFLVLLAVVTRRRCRLRRAVKYCLAVLLLAAVFWLLGGTCGTLYASAFPDNCPSDHFGWHSSRASLARYAWVRGSYWGITFGGLLAVMIVTVRAARARRTEFNQVDTR